MGLVLLETTKERPTVPLGGPRLPLPCWAHRGQLVPRREEGCSGIMVSGGCGLCFFVY